MTNECGPQCWSISVTPAALALRLADCSNADLYEGRLTKAREEQDDLQDRLSRLGGEIGRAEAAVLQRVRAVKDLRTLLSMAVHGVPNTEFSGRINDLQAALKEVQGVDIKQPSKIEPVRIKLKAALGRLIKSIRIHLVDETFSAILEIG